MRAEQIVEKDENWNHIVDPKQGVQLVPIDLELARALGHSHVTWKDGKPMVKTEHQPASTTD